MSCKWRARLLPRSDTTLSHRSRDTSPLALLTPLQQGDGHDAGDEDQTCHETSTASLTERFVHICVPERTQESPSGAYDVDKDTNAGAVLDIAVNGVGDKNGGDDLVADGRDGDADLVEKSVMML